MLTATTVVLPLLLTFTVAAYVPTDADGNPVPRSKRTPWGNLRALLAR